MGTPKSVSNRASRLRKKLARGEQISDLDRRWYEDYKSKTPPPGRPATGAVPLSAGAQQTPAEISSSVPAETAPNDAAKGPVDPNRQATVPAEMKPKTEPKKAEPGDKCKSCGHGVKGPKNCPDCGTKLALDAGDVKMLLVGMNMMLWDRFPAIEIVNGQPTIHVDEKGRPTKTMKISDEKGFMGMSDKSEMDMMAESTCNLLDHYDIHLAQGLVVWLGFGTAVTTVMVPRVVGVFAFMKWQKQQQELAKKKAEEDARRGATIRSVKSDEAASPRANEVSP